MDYLGNIRIIGWGDIMAGNETPKNVESRKVLDFAFHIRTLLNGASGMLELMAIAESEKEREDFRVNSLKAIQQAAQAIKVLVVQVSGKDTPKNPQVEPACTAPTSATTKPMPEKGEPRNRPLSILVADDNDINKKIVSRILSSRGHSVVLASNGVEAVNAYMRGRFDLVLMDVMMPEMSGTEAARIIRERRRSSDRQVPIVALTALDEGDKEMWQAVMDGYLAKPFELQKFDDLIAKVAAMPPPAEGSVE